MRALIAGVKFHPPARAILSALGADTPLVLEREPSNPYDSAAIAVKVRAEHLPADEAFVVQLHGYGTSLSELIAARHVMLGYIPKTDNLAWAEAMRQSPCATARLTFDPTGRAQVALDT